MPDTTAQIAGKGCNATGITEDLAVTLHANLGRKVLAVVELVSASRSEKLDGKESVILNILTVEPAPDQATEDHLRELARSFHYERKLQDSDGQLIIDTRDDLEPKVADVLAAGKQLEPHAYVDDPTQPGWCDVCGEPDDDIRHDADLASDGGDDEEPDPPTQE